MVYGVNFTAYYNDQDLKSSAENIVYSGLHKYVWGLSCGWVIFACAKGYGGTYCNASSPSDSIEQFYLIGIVNSFLSWKVFMPLAK